MVNDRDQVFRPGPLQLVRLSFVLIDIVSSHDSLAVKYTGPWFQTQLTLASTIGLISFLLFTYAKTRWLVLFAPRTKLKGGSSSTKIRKLRSS